MPSVESTEAHCDKHGPFRQTVLVAAGAIGDLPTLSQCPECRAEDKAKAERIQREAEERDRQYRIKQQLENSMIPPRFKEKTFANYTADDPGQKKALAFCRKFAETWPEQKKKGGSLVLTGGPGTGKTHLACAVANHVIRAHVASVRFDTILRAVRTVKDTYRRESDVTEQAAINRLCHYDLLILDEVGAQIGSAHESMLVFDILNARYEQMRPTILMSNLPADELEELLGQRVMDRYRECGVVVPFDWNSHRGIAA